MKKSVILYSVLSLSLASCAAQPTQITTITQAARLTNLAEQAGDAYIKTGHPSAATATTINHLRADVRAAMDSLYDNVLQGKSLAYSTLTTALAALNAAISTSSNASSTAASN